MKAKNGKGPHTVEGIAKAVAAAMVLDSGYESEETKLRAALISRHRKELQAVADYGNANFPDVSDEEGAANPPVIASGDPIQDADDAAEAFHG